MANESSIHDVGYSEYVDTNWTSSDNSSTGSGSCSVEVSSAREEMEVLRSVRWGIAILVTLTVLSSATIGMFLHSWMKIRRHVPYGNRRIFLVRLFGLFPVFSGTSLAGFYVPKASLIANWGASLYLSTTLYTFVLLIVDYYGGVEPMEHHIEGIKVSLSAPPLTCCCPCLPKINFTMTNFHRLRRLVLQTAYIRPLCVFIGAVLWADGIYKPSIIEADSAFVYLSSISLVSSLVAVYGLSVIYNATHTTLQHFMISIKFTTIKCVLIITNGQNLLIAILIATDVIPCVGPLDSAVRGELLYNMLVVFEMFLLTFSFKLYYWRWMVKHEYGHRFASASVGDFADLGENAPMKITHDRLNDLQEKSSANGSLSNISKTGSFKSETVV
ncbi:organic solute transporter subunit alpha-like [Lytechinus pictus]|uniref:organic solute transporter subunit alpha-like n=1 Tax=Lytechinus pictus TaxID=7653 RepID=UPI0030BA1734